jgi:transposase
VLAAKLGVPADEENASAPPAPLAKPKAKPKGRRDVKALPIAEERHEILDPDLEGKAPRIGFEESYQLGWRKAGPVRLVIARAKYRISPETDAPTIFTAELPPRTFARSLAAPSLLAKILTDKYCDGLPLYRQEERFAREVSISTAARCAGGSRMRG